MLNADWRSDYHGSMGTSDHNPYRTPTVALIDASESGSVYAWIRSWIANLNGRQLLLFAVGCGFFAFSISSFITAGFLRQQFLAEQKGNVTVTELFAAPLQGLASAFLGACFVISSCQQRVLVDEDRDRQA